MQVVTVPCDPVRLRPSRSMADGGSFLTPSYVEHSAVNPMTLNPMEAYGVTREQLAMVSVLMSRQSARHPDVSLAHESYTTNARMQQSF